MTGCKVKYLEKQLLSEASKIKICAKTQPFLRLNMIPIPSYYMAVF